jgi:hypothetical protein
VNDEETCWANRCLEVLKGGNLAAITRSYSLAVFLFAKGDEEYVLFVKAGFRMTVEGEVFLATEDIFKPGDAQKGSEGFDHKLFDWSVQGANRYDERADAIDERYGLGLFVTDAAVNRMGDLSVQLTDSVRIEVYTTLSQGECWRLIKRNSRDAHLVVTACGLEQAGSEG